MAYPVQIQHKTCCSYEDCGGFPARCQNEGARDKAAGHGNEQRRTQPGQEVLDFNWCLMTFNCASKISGIYIGQYCATGSDILKNRSIDSRTSTYCTERILAVAFIYLYFTLLYSSIRLEFEPT